MTGRTAQGEQGEGGKASPATSSTFAMKMIPLFDHSLSAEMIRDGGSLAMCFESEGQSFWLFFPLVMDEHHTRVCYKDPVVINRTLGTEESILW